jgi:hypothetical protein
MENTDKIITLASFVLNDKVESFKRYLKKRFNIPEERIFMYTSDEEKGKTILTFRIYLKEGRRVDTSSFFPPTIIVHKKGECLYTINALNKLIEQLIGEKGNINYKSYKIDWDDYQDRMLIVRSDELKIIPIKRNFS